MSDTGFPRIVGRLPPAMELCLRCRFHVYAGTATCPHCQAELVPLRRAHDEAMNDVLTAIQKLKEALNLTKPA